MMQFRNSTYYVSEDAMLINKKNGKDYQLNSFKTFDGYHYYTLYLSPNLKTNILAHRLVAECYLSGFSHKLQVNHIDENKSNNHISNIEMVDCKENISKFQGNYKEYFVTKNWSGESKLCKTHKEVMEFCGYSSRSSVEYLVNNPISKKYTMTINTAYYNKK